MTEHDTDDELQCISDGGALDPCEGPVEYRMALSATGRSFPRCDKHWAKRLDEYERDQRNFPDSPIPPSWFDPTAAGEHWDDDY
jgi:hypothetical protein